MTNEADKYQEIRDYLDYPSVAFDEAMARDAGHRRVVIVSVVAACKLVQSKRAMGKYS